MTSAVQSSTTEQSPTTEPSDKAVSEQSPTTEPSDKAVSEQVSASELMPMYFNPNLKSCSNCGCGGSLKRCPCVAVAYCSKQCQKEHWKSGHRALCPVGPVVNPSGKDPKDISMVIRGKHQHKTMDQVLRYQQGPLKGMPRQGVDAHFWHEINGDVYGLASVTSIESLPDGDVPYDGWVRRRFKHHLESVLKRDIVAALEFHIEHTFQEVNVRGRAHHRAHYLMKAYPGVFTADTLRVGSIGYKNNDGTIFWEYG